MRLFQYAIKHTDAVGIEHPALFKHLSGYVHPIGDNTFCG